MGPAPIGIINAFAEIEQMLNNARVIIIFLIIYNSSNFNSQMCEYLLLMKPRFSQNIIAMVWDFDKTLIPYYMQKPMFQEYGVDEKQFWDEVIQLPKLYEKQGIKLSPDTAYLNHILTYVRKGIFKNLSNKKLRELGSQLEMFPGLPDFFQVCQELVLANDLFRRFEIKVEHYIVSTGLTEIIRGSTINRFVNGIWGCEFIESAYEPVSGSLSLIDGDGCINDIAYQIDNTTKTRALFEINKGVNVHPDDISVNQAMPEQDRRVPFKNMIYIADGPSDVPAFSVVKKNQGKTFAVYNKSNPLSFKQAQQLHKDGRVDACFEADYTESSTAYLWLTNEIIQIAEQIALEKKSSLRQGKDSVPTHIN